MRKSRLEAEQTRRRIVTAAAAEFRANGIDGTGLADLMKAAGMTHGGFYKHFDSKDQVVTEACSEALESTLAALAGAAEGKRGRKVLKAIAEGYLSTAHRDDPRAGCTLAALGSELARADAGTRERMSAGFERMVDILAGQFEGTDRAAAKKRAMAAASAMIGALTMSRLITDARLSESLLAAAAEYVAGP